MRKLGVFAAVAVLMTLALPAMAHDFDGGGDCDGWTLTIDGVFGAWQIEVDGNEVHSGGPGFSPGPNPGAPFDVFIADDSDAETREFVVFWNKIGNSFGGDRTVTETLTRDLDGCNPVVVTPVAPEIIQSEVCEVEGSVIVPTTEGVIYMLDGEDVSGQTLDGPLSGTIIATPSEGFVFDGEGQSIEFDLNVEASDECPEPTTPTSTTLPATTTTLPSGTTTPTDPESSTTTTVVAETSTTEAPATTVTSVSDDPEDDPDELPFTGMDESLPYVGAGLLLAGLATLGLTRRKLTD